MSLLEDWPPGGPAALDPRVRLALDAQGPAAEFRTLGVERVRAEFARNAGKTPRVGDPVARTENLLAAGRVPVRLYRPQGPGPHVPVAYFHGGGWVYGDLDTHDDLCRSLCARSRALVMAVDYRLAPEHRHAASLDDAYDAAAWLAAEARSLGADPARLAVCGDSAGGNLAAAVALRARDSGGFRIALQALVYPVTDAGCGTGSYRDFAEGHGLTAANMRWFWDCTLGPGVQAGPLASMMQASDLRGLPPAWFTLAACDVLRDEGEAYAGRLAEAGVRVRGRRYLGMHHGFLRWGAVFPQALRALDDLAAALQQA